jgi:hypothetical protein
VHAGHDNSQQVSNNSEADSRTWDRVVAADKLIDANTDVVAACRETAAKAGKEQKCTITVPAPEKR